MVHRIEKFSECSCDFEVKRIIPDDYEDSDQAYLFDEIIDNNSNHDWNNAVKYYWGHVKWDGCINIYSSGYTHYCEIEELEKIGEVFRMIFDDCMQLMN